MSMPPCGTFVYRTVLPADLGDRRGPWACELNEPVKELPEHLPLHDSLFFKNKPSLWTNRLVGYSPVMRASDAGSIRNGPPVRLEHGALRPEVALSRIDLVASGPAHAECESFTFWVDRGLLQSLRPRDVLITARSRSASLGLALFRDDRLLLAAGAVTEVPLGSEVSARYPFGAITEGRNAFRAFDPKFEFAELPVEITVNGKTAIRYRSMSWEGPYDVWMDHGFHAGVPSDGECIAISLRGSAPVGVALSTARLLDNWEPISRRMSASR
jgi:hypothetical protein